MRNFKLGIIDFTVVLTIILSFLTNYSQLLAANPYQINIESVKEYQEITKLKLSTEFKPVSSENAFQIYAENYADMVLLLINDDPNSFKINSNSEDQRLKILETFPKNSPFYRFYQAEIRLHWAFVKLKFGKELSGSWEIIKAYRLLAENVKLYPNFLPSYKSLGLLHVLIGSTPNNYKWVARLLGLEGDIQKGLSEIQKVYERDSVFRNETHLIYILIHSYILKYDEKVNDDLLKFVSQNPDNLMIHFFGVTVSMKDNRSEQALKILNEMPLGSAYLPFPFIDYVKAEILIQKGQYKPAEALLNSFLGRYKGRNFIKDAYYKLLLCAWLNGDELTAKKRAQLIIKVGQTVVESDKAALKFANKFLNNKITPAQKVLMRARLAFDGGYLNEALAYLKGVKEVTFPDVYDKAEYNYRSGRVFQKLNQNALAIEFYSRAISLSKDNDLYFGAVSYLQLGYIYQALKNRALAITNFRNALDYPSHEYKNSIDNKAKAALNELNVE